MPANSRPPAAKRTHPTTRRRPPTAWLGGGFSVLLVAGLVALAAAKLSLREVARALGAVHAGWVVAAAALMLAAFLARAESWFVVIRVALPEATIARRAVLKVLMIGMAASALAPGRVGEAARAWLIARRAGGARAALATAIGTVVSQTLLNLLALLLLTMLALAGGAIPAARTIAIPVAIVLPALIVAVLWGGPPMLGQLDRRLPGRPRGWAAWAAGQLTQARHGVAIYRRVSMAVHSGSFQLAAWGLQCASCYTVLLALDLQHRGTVATAAAILVAVNVTAVVPLTPSNVGIFQAACMAVLARVHVPASTGLAYGLVLQGVEVVVELAIGLPALVHEGLSFNQIRHSGHVR